MPLEKMWKIYEAIDNKFLEQFGFRIKETTFLNIVEYLHLPKDSSSLAVTRILFGVAMLFDIPDERGGATMELRWGRPICHFPLISFLRALPMPYMALVYTALWLGAAGITLGYKYRLSSIMFAACYWYLFLIEKSLWNNHSYLFGLIALLLSFTEANCYWSVDAYLDPTKKKETVPYWNYFILKYQFFILYFMAGMKKGTAEWLTGYSVQNLSEHWVFDPFKLFLTVPQIDYLIVHWFIFVFDLTVAMWMMWSRTRHIAMLFCAMFHLMNSRLFRIGMFPWVCLATMPLFYPFDWPKILLSYLNEKYKNIKKIFNEYLVSMKYCKCTTQKENLNEPINEVEHENMDSEENVEITEDCNRKLDDEIKSCFEESSENTDPDTQFISHIETQNTEIIEESSENTVPDTQNTPDIETQNTEITEYELNDPTKPADIKNTKTKQIMTTYMIIFHVITQLFLPYSHFITQGYNNWTNGIYGYSWDMMVHTWDTHSVIVKVVDNDSGKEFYIDPSIYTLNDRWTRHGDMVYQYAHCLKEILLNERNKFDSPEISENFSIYIDVWCSMNGRFTQRLFDPKVDMLKASWSPLRKVPYLMPLLDEVIHWRSTLQKITEDLHKWSNNSDVIFLADFPGYEQEKFIPPDLSNVTLTVLEGAISYEPEATKFRPGFSYYLTKGDRIQVESGLFHKVLVTGEKPAYYMYTFTNATEIKEDLKKVKPKLPILYELYVRFKGMYAFASVVIKYVYILIFGCNGKC